MRPRFAAREYVTVGVSDRRKFGGPGNGNTAQVYISAISSVVVVVVVVVATVVIAAGGFGPCCRVPAAASVVVVKSIVLIVGILASRGSRLH
ncbi:hypothetical protein EDB89DRAFT_1933069 [Lactarius sanguifluus]|nr:hypothetical protein EDB89DRAFT_1933069 [Lactarius sanguifluus]